MISKFFSIFKRRSRIEEIVDCLCRLAEGLSDEDVEELARVVRELSGYSKK
ncbi:MAG: hypothetical protein J7K15_10235 [Deltaproteobacteria bacterium]|nr:hypothetical protein [Deltaproteobacteria bacterium]